MHMNASSTKVFIFCESVALLACVIIIAFLLKREVPQTTSVGVESASSSSQAEVADETCKDAATQLDMNFCAAHEQQIAEKKLDEALASLKQRILQKPVLSPSVLSGIEESQKRWEQYRDAECAAVAAAYEGASIAPMNIAFCRKNLAEERTKILLQDFELQE